MNESRSRLSERRFSGIRKGLALLAILVPGVVQSAVIYEENFSSVELTGKINPYLGGWFATENDPMPVAESSQITFGEWANAESVSITAGETLSTPSDSGFRGGAIALDPSIFLGAGTYILEYDVIIDTMGNDGVATVNVWAGSGYDLSFTSGNAIQLDTESGQLDSYGDASSLLLAGQTHTTDLLNASLSFNYDGTSAVVLFFGATAGGFPFPAAEYDNINLSTAVPEPSSILMMMALAPVLARRRRR